VDGFLEEMIIRRELADNFCFYEPNYDNIKCAAPWAMESLNKHRGDKREHLYNECAPPPPMPLLSRNGVLSVGLLAAAHRFVCRPVQPVATPPLHEKLHCVACCCMLPVDTEHSIKSIRSLYLDAGRSWRRGRRTTSCGMRRSWSWCTPARCTASCACAEPKT
jgi:hypothetical protein